MPTIIGSQESNVGQCRLSLRERALFRGAKGDNTLLRSNSRFFGVVVFMNHGDHAPPHFHAKYGGDEALITIDGPALIRGRLPPRILGFVVERAVIHRAELQDDWERASRLEPLLPIDPLE